MILEFCHWAAERETGIVWGRTHGQTEISMDNKQLPLNMQGSIQVKLNRQHLWYGIGWHKKKFWLNLFKKKKRSYVWVTVRHFQRKWMEPICKCWSCHLIKIYVVNKHYPYTDDICRTSPITIIICKSFILFFVLILQQPHCEIQLTTNREPSPCPTFLTLKHYNTEISCYLAT